MNIDIDAESSDITACSTTKCNTICNIGFIIRHHVKCIMQLLTNDIPQFNIRLQTTKCLNTAVMLMQFLLGNKGLQIVDACDTRDVIERHKSGVESNDMILQELKKQIFSKREKSRTLYYILLSDGYFPGKDVNNNDIQKYFPGHVFILEKIYNVSSKQHIFYFYQSYINKYSLTEHIEMNKGLKISHKRAEELLNDLSSVLKSPTWNNDNVKKWYDMTFVDSSDFLETQSHQQFYLCFRKAKTTDCLDRLKKYLNKKYELISKIPSSESNIIYGNEQLYDNNIKPLSNKQMLIEIESLLFKINKTQSQVSNI
jgi:hypothetical protein